MLYQSPSISTISEVESWPKLVQDPLQLWFLTTPNCWFRLPQALRLSIVNNRESFILFSSAFYHWLPVVQVANRCPVSKETLSFERMGARPELTIENATQRILHMDNRILPNFEGTALKLVHESSSMDMVNCESTLVSPAKVPNKLNCKVFYFPLCGSCKDTSWCAFAVLSAFFGRKRFCPSLSGQSQVAALFNTKKKSMPRTSLPEDTTAYVSSAKKILKLQCRG